jgi:Undecaprenyl-phosphate galactose phosphotransferase WbaP
MFESAALSEVQGRKDEERKKKKTAGKRREIHRIRSKRVFDLVVSAILLIGIGPAMVVIAWLVRRDGGPALFGHVRVGASGRTFRCWKFRTMVVDSDRVLRELLERDPEARAEWERDFKLRSDPRITGIGRFLRRNSLDELPQLINVLTGEMSLTGPRPIVRQEIERYGEYIGSYWQCRPGLSGPWQVSGRNNVSYQTRVTLDHHYVENWSFTRDLGILVKTVIVVLRRSGAY